MGDAFSALKRYFQVQLDRCGKRPGLHRRKRDDCALYLKVLDDTGSPEAFREYVERTGNMVSTGKAEAADRYDNRAFIYEKLGQTRKVREDRERVAIIEGAETHRDVAEKLEAFERQSKVTMQENSALAAVASVMRAVFHLATDPKGSEAQKRNIANLNAYWKQMKESDPGHSWEQIMTYAPYRDRLPFTDSQMGLLNRALREVKDGR
ncbi:MAG: hypothetical protein JXA20_17335 [Spirochaetes bacterium]|nr:hypothetical protein [Spirochaetota bacterium]